MPTKKPEQELFSVEPPCASSVKKSSQLVPKSIGEKTYEIAKKVENKSKEQIVIQNKQENKPENKPEIKPE